MDTGTKIYEEKELKLTAMLHIIVQVFSGMLEHMATSTQTSSTSTQASNTNTSTKYYITASASRGVPVYATALAVTQCANPRRDGQAE